MRVKDADGEWVSQWEVERKGGEHRFLSKQQVDRLEYLDDNYCCVAECWDNLVTSRRELAETHAALARGHGNARALGARVKAAAKLVQLVERRVESGIRGMDLEDIQYDLACDYDQDYKLLLLERLSEIASPEN